MKIPHPLKRDYTLNHSSLFGPENAVFLRGRITSQTEIALPEYWSEFVEERSISVHLTSVGAHQDVIVKRIGQNRIWLQAKGGMPIDCYYLVIAERRDIPKLKVEQPT
jgi:hypothetical protein